jgi:hypothetical protein
MAALTAISAVVFVASGVRAQEDADFNPCAGLRGQAFGLCMSYTKGMDCSSDNPNAPQVACENVSKMFEEVSGYPPPSACPCNFSLERISDPNEGWISQEYLCRARDQFVPPSPGEEDGAGEKYEWLLTGDELGHWELFDVALVQLSAWRDKVRYLCMYMANDGVGGHEQVDITVYSTASDYLEVVEDLRVKYDACKGAISVLAAAVPLVNPPDPWFEACVFD